MKRFFCIMLGVLVFSVTVFATPQQDYSNAQKELDKINDEIKSINNEKKQQETQKKKAQAQKDLIEKQIAAMLAQIEETTQQLAITQETLDIKKRDIYETDELFKARLKALYIRRTSGALSTVLAVDDFADFLTATVNLQKISMSDTDLLKKLDEEKRQIEAEEAKIAAALQALQAQKALQEQKEKELAATLKLINSDLNDANAELLSKQQEYDIAYNNMLEAKSEIDKIIGGAGGTGEYVGGDWTWPVPGFPHISSGFGPRILNGRPDNHIGIDIAKGQRPTIQNAAIVASNSGTVTKAIYSNRGYGNYVLISHGGNNFTLYGHCSSLAVSEGQTVAQGQTIAYVGNTGNSFGHHLHFEIRLNGVAVNAEPLVVNRYS